MVRLIPLFVILGWFFHSLRTLMKSVLLCAGLLAAVTITTGQERLRVGDPAPMFTLPYATKDSIHRGGLRLEDIIGSQNIILAFYPANWSGGCTREMCMMRDNFASLSELNATVFGISGDYVYAHHEWAKHLELPFGLLSDHDHSVARLYESYNPETGFNRRTVYVINRSGKISYIDPAYDTRSPDSFERLRSALADHQ